jgi:CheY-like chemotaxis protein
MEVIALVEDGREAVRRAIEDRPDVVLMDIAMQKPPRRTPSCSSALASRARMMQQLGIGDFASLVRFAIKQGVSPLE